MDKNSKKIVITMTANIPKLITLQSPAIYGSSALSKNSRSSKIYVTPEKQKTISNVATIVDKNTDS